VRASRITVLLVAALACKSGPGKELFPDILLSSGFE
jgi:hypothetical protein